jgi:lysophospholipase L1-like esterase
MTIDWGWSGAVPVPGDYDGDGRTDFAVYYRDGGSWYVLSANGQALAAPFNWGWNKSWPVPADYDGDGKTEPAVYHRESGTWYIGRLNDRQAVGIVPWGWGAAIPVPGDYDGDRRADLAVYHRSSGRWYITSLSGQPITTSLQLGGPDQCPIQSYASPGTEGVTYISFGDSITYGDASSSESPRTGYPFLLEKKLKVYFGGSFRSINAGVSGEMTFGGVRRASQMVSANPADAFLLMEGTNDMLYDDVANQTEANLRFMIQYALNRGLHSIVATIPPVIVSAYRDRSAQAGRIVDFNPRIYGIAARFGIPVAQVYEEITAVPRWYSLLMDQVSANHPNDAGYLRVRDAFFKQVSAGLISGSMY